MFRGNKTPVLKIYTWACKWFSWHLPFLSMFTVYNILCHLYILYTLYVHIINSKICMPKSVFFYSKSFTLWIEARKQSPQLLCCCFLVSLLLLPGFLPFCFRPVQRKISRILLHSSIVRLFFKNLLTYYFFFWDLKKSSLLWKIFAFKFTSLGHFMF